MKLKWRLEMRTLDLVSGSTSHMAFDVMVNLNSCANKNNKISKLSR